MLPTGNAPRTGNREPGNHEPRNHEPGNHKPGECQLRLESRIGTEYLRAFLFRFCNRTSVVPILLQAPHQSHGFQGRFAVTSATHQVHFHDAPSPEQTPSILQNPPRSVNEPGEIFATAKRPCGNAPLPQGGIPSANRDAAPPRKTAGQRQGETGSLLLLRLFLSSGSHRFNGLQHVREIHRSDVLPQFRQVVHA